MVSCSKTLCSKKTTRIWTSFGGPLQSGHSTAYSAEPLLSHGFVVFQAVGCDEEVEGHLGIHAGFGLPDIVEVTFCFGLNRLRHGIQYIARFVEPATLFFSRAKDYRFPRRSEPDRRIISTEI
jgi:hypothetical protein